MFQHVAALHVEWQMRRGAAKQDEDEPEAHT